MGPNRVSVVTFQHPSGRKPVRILATLTPPYRHALLSRRNTYYLIENLRRILTSGWQASVSTFRDWPNLSGLLAMAQPKP
jgi:hypothetical protein